MLHLPSVFIFFFSNLILFIFGCAGSLLLCGLSLVAVRGLLVSVPARVPEQRLPGAESSEAVAHERSSCGSWALELRLSSPEICGIFPDQGLNPCFLHWQANSLPLSHQGSPLFFFWWPVPFALLCQVTSVLSSSGGHMDCSPPGSPVRGNLQARMLEWVAIAFSRGFFLPRDRTWVSCIAGGFFTVWTTRGSKAIYHTSVFFAILQLCLTVHLCCSRQAFTRSPDFCFTEQRNKLEAAYFKKETPPPKKKQICDPCPSKFWFISL